MVKETKEFNPEEFKDMFRIDELDNLYEQYYGYIETVDDTYTEHEKVAASIYACMKTVEVPMIYGEYEVYETINPENVKELVQKIEETDEGYEKGELSEQNCWDYVFFDLNNNNITAHAENFAQQLVEYYNKSEKFKSLIDSYDPKISALASMFMYRNMTPTATAPANHISFDKSPLLIGDQEIDKYDVIEAYHQIYDKPDETPALTYNHLDDSGILKEIVNILDKLELEEDKRDSIMYIMYEIQSDEVDYDHHTVAVILLEEYTDLDKTKLLEITNTSEAKFDRIKNKLNYSEILF